MVIFRNTLALLKLSRSVAQIVNKLTLEVVLIFYEQMEWWGWAFQDFGARH